MAVSAVLGVVLVLGAIGYLSLAAYVWIHREIPGAAGLVVCLLALGMWTVCYALELSSSTVEVARWWSGLKFVGIVLLAPGLWAFVLRYTSNSEPLPKVVIALLLLQPTATLALLAIPATRGLIHYYPLLLPGQGAHQAYIGRSPQAELGPLFWPHAVYTYVMLFGAIGLLVARLARLARPFRRQGAILMAAVILPFVGNVMFNAKIYEFGGVDPSPFLFSVSAVILVWGLLRVRLFGILKVARSVVLDRLPEGVLVLDAYGRIADVNVAGANLLGLHRDRLIGTVLTDRLPGAGRILDRHRPSATTDGELHLPDDGVDIAVQVTSVLQAGEETSRLVVLRDVSESKATQRRLLDLLREQTMLAETLQQSLRPASLPAVPGARLAARWVPATGVDGPLSGDFYDVHPAGQGRQWAFILGDVVGKGVHAAVLTALARYTARTLSARALPPVEVLHALNEALLSEDTERFCTVVYGLVDAGPEAGLRVRLVLGGHPPPLLRRLDGRVTTAGVPGMALGLVQPVEVEEVEVSMRPGEILLAYTDGVTEARSPLPGGGGRASTEQFGEERLARVLAGALPHAESVADSVLHAVAAFAVHRDDLAVLVIEAT